MSAEEQRLLDKLRKIEALVAGATTEGEKDAAQHARERVMARLQEFEAVDPVIEIRFGLDNSWSKRLFLALLRRYGLRPYRYHRQRHTTVMVKASKRFVDEVLWPEFEALDDVLTQYLDQVAERVVSQVLDADSSEPISRPKQRELDLTAPAPRAAATPSSTTGPSPATAPKAAPPHASEANDESKASQRGGRKQKHPRGKKKRGRKGKKKR